MPAGRPVGALVALVLVLASQLPLSEAGFSDTYVVSGRVLDAEGLPAGHVTVIIELEGASAGPGRSDRTSCQGDFQARFQVSDVSGAQVRVSVEDETVSQGADATFRRSFVRVEVPGTQAPEACDAARDGFGREHLVTGRVLTPAGQPAAGETVHVRLELGGGGDLTAEQAIDDEGAFAVGFQSSKIQAGGTAVLTVGNRTWQEPLDTRFGVTVADHALEPPPSEPLSIPWGTIGLALGTILGLAALVAGAFFLLHHRGRGEGDR